MTLRQVPTRILEEWVRRVENLSKHFQKGSLPDGTYFQYESLKEDPDENGYERNVYTLAEIKAELDRRYAIELGRTI